jgi:hypothetical protein
MRRTAFAVLAMVAALAMLAPAAGAQAPAPRVTVNGLIEHITTWSGNMSISDNNYDRAGDTEWFARTRVRPDLTAEVGTTKAVLGLEIDAAWGRTGATDTTPPQRFATTHSWDLNTDAAGVMELKWAYAEFDVPFLRGGRLRLGAQPFETTFKLAALASGDFAGAHVSWRGHPNLAVNATYAQIEEALSGPRDGFLAGEDYAGISSVEVTPLTGLSVRPIYAYASYDGTTSGASRQGRGGVATTDFALGNHERRHTIGVDARWKRGPFYVDPTVLYQVGHRERTIGGVELDQDRQAWFIDLRGGWQHGPLLLEAAAIYTTGNKASQSIQNGRERLRYYEPIDTDTTFYAGWSEMQAIGIDGFTLLYATVGGLDPGVGIGYDKYGMKRLGTRASYALTPALLVKGALLATWTAEEVDTTSTFATASGLTPGDGRGRHSYLGTELNLGITWRFAPSIVLDLVGGYLWVGRALGYAAGPAGPSPDPEDAQKITARFRYTF